MYRPIVYTSNDQSGGSGSGSGSPGQGLRDEPPHVALDRRPARERLDAPAVPARALRPI